MLPPLCATMVLQGVSGMYFPANMTAQYFFFDTYPGQFLQVLPAALLVGVLCYALQRRVGPVPRKLRLWRAVFACYLAGLIAVTVVPMGLWGGLWYRLLYGQPGGGTVELFTFTYSFDLDLSDFDGEKAMNLLLFAPFPMLHCLSCRLPRWSRTAAAGGLAVLAVELLQPVFGRAFDVNDIVLNLAGSLAATGLVFGLRAALRRCSPEGSG